TPKVSDIITFGEYTKEDIIFYCAVAEQYSSHPIAKTIIDFYGKDAKKATSYSEKPGYGVFAEFENKRLFCGSKRILPPDFNKKDIPEGAVYLTVNGNVAGAVILSDNIREEAKDTVSKLNKLGIKDTVMLSGDEEEKAKAVSEKIGLSKCYGSLLPEDKVSKLKELKDFHKSTIYVGDGINDAPVISLASCGIAMGLGSGSAIEASDAVLSDGTLKKLPYMIKKSRQIMNTIKTNIVFALGFKTIVILLAIMGIAPIWLAVFADTGVSVLCILNATRLLYR
ncbi:MAG: HAD-IC family P-type ATPase, partial [Acutalibacteraceae bacterium]